MCTDFQRRNKKINEKLIKNQVSRMKIWSILLGYNGVVDNGFYEKYISVLNVRRKIRNELYISIFSFIGFVSIYLIAIRSNNDFINVLQYPMYIFIGLSIISFFAHLKVIREWRNHDLKMLEDFYGTIDNDDN